ncbi:MAG TPA: hypothetical protein VKU01_09825 [Bryobacteraceae bacterium]|nr:hypothetical protein [Bryobacteraceae bacterium]
MRQKLNILAVAFLLASPAAAETKSMVALYKVQFGKLNEYIATLKAVVAPALDRLVSDGVIESYGVDIDVLHSPNQPNLAAWFSGPTYASLQKADETVLAALASHPQESRMLLEGADMNAHSDLLLEASTSKFGHIPDGAMPFKMLIYERVKPAKISDYLKYGTKYFTPVYDQLIKDGVVYGYQVFEQAVHTQDPGGIWIVVTVPDMATLDKLDTVFEARMKAMPPDEKSIMENSTRDWTDEAAHRDYVMRAVAFKMK